MKKKIKHTRDVTTFDIAERMTRRDAKSEVITFKATPALKAEIESVCRGANIKQSTFIRNAIVFALEIIRETGRPP